ncbi:uncharacterized protein BJX67DRAFT_363933 [Aspergillus lucknowensis]|uniref:Uncharacterized protein n=1 Tax=Aspergillus lucknowensis TaxID=176173 RepID=A0ABR4LFU0_9EURO
MIAFLTRDHDGAPLMPVPGDPCQTPRKKQGYLFRLAAQAAGVHCLFESFELSPHLHARSAIVLPHVESQLLSTPEFRSTSRPCDTTSRDFTTQQLVPLRSDPHDEDICRSRTLALHCPSVQAHRKVAPAKESVRSQPDKNGRDTRGENEQT